LIEYYRVNPTLFDRFLRFCIANHSKLISVSKVYEYLKSLRLKCSKSTLIKYLEFSKEVFFLLPVEIFFLLNKGEKALPKKLYIVDNGLINSLHQEEFLGKLIENTVAIELLREERGIDVHYW
jgi:predicted AAA+ superfamily ATPase